MVSAAPGAALMLLQPRAVSATLIRFVLVPVAVVAVLSALAPEPVALLLNRLLSLAQVAYGMLLGYLCCWSLQRLGGRRLAAILRWLVPLYLFLLAIETVFWPLQTLIRSYQETVYPATTDIDSLINRETGMGGYRPKFFTSETSFVSISALLLITAFLWIRRDFLRYPLSIAYTLFALVVIRSPIVALTLPIILATALTDPRYKRLRASITIAAGLGTIIGVIGIYAIIGNVINNRIANAASGQDYSVTFRTYGSFAVAAAVLQQYPLVGVGPGGIDLAKNQIITTEIQMGVPAPDVMAAWRISITNVPATLAVHFGIIGIIVGCFTIYRLFQIETLAPRLPLAVAIAAWFMSIGGVYTPKVIATTIFLVSLYIVSQNRPPNLRPQRRYNPNRIRIAPQTSVAI